MPTTDLQEASSSPSSHRFSILGQRQIHSMEHGHDQKVEWEAFQRQVADRLQSLSSVSSDDLLTIPWIRKLLDAFLLFQEEFRVLVSKHSSSLNRPPIDRHIADFYERGVKALDVCNAIRDGIEHVRQWEKQLDIVLYALDRQKSVGEGHFRRAKKALIDLSIAMLDVKEASAPVSHRNWSLGRNSVHKKPKPLSQFRSLSLSVSRSWSASKQLQAIGYNLVVPRPNEIVSTHGLSLAIFTMNYMLLFVMWALVAAIPCQDRGLQMPFSLTKQFVWAPPMLLIHERILEESKRRDRRNACGLLREIHDIEKCNQHISELIDSVQFPLTEENEGELKQGVQEMQQVYESIKIGLDPLEHQVREVFHRILRCRTEGLGTISQNKQL